jgi:hypothetical protein
MRLRYKLKLHEQYDGKMMAMPVDLVISELYMVTGEEVTDSLVNQAKQRK